MNNTLVKTAALVVAKHALLVGAFAAAGTVAVDVRKLYKLYRSGALDDFGK